MVVGVGKGVGVAAEPPPPPPPPAPPPPPPPVGGRVGAGGRAGVAIGVGTGSGVGVGNGVGVGMELGVGSSVGVGIGLGVGVAVGVAVGEGAGCVGVAEGVGALVGDGRGVGEIGVALGTFFSPRSTSANVESPLGEEKRMESVPESLGRRRSIAPSSLIRIPAKRALFAPFARCAIRKPSPASWPFCRFSFSTWSASTIVQLLGCLSSVPIAEVSRVASF